MDHLKAKKIRYLEGQLEIWEDKLNDFKKEYAHAEGAEARFSLKRKINDEINPAIAEINKQYITLIDGVDIVEAEAKPIIEEFEKAAENTSYQLSDELQQQLSAILQEIRGQNKNSVAKLRVILPIIPMLFNYELELDKEKFWNDTYGKINGKIRGLLKKKADIVNP